MFTLGEEFADDSDYLNACRNKRNISDYDAAGTISEQEAREIADFASELYQKLQKWLGENFKQYI